MQAVDWHFCLAELATLPRSTSVQSKTGSPSTNSSLSPLTESAFHTKFPEIIFSTSMTSKCCPARKARCTAMGGAGGAVVIANNRPVLNRLQITSLLEAGNYAFGHNTSVINVPLSDHLAVRAAVDYAYHQGYFTEGADAENQVAGRLSSLYEDGTFTGYVWYNFNNTAGAPPSFTTLIGNNFFENPSNPWNNYSCRPTGVGVPLGANPSCDPDYITAPTQSAHTSIGGGEFDWRFNGFTVSLTPSLCVRQCASAAIFRSLS